ncbi:MAG: mRNA surveillance protein pelota [Thermoproteota archaeon]|nr:MAG: mRNA surveillance protein pelota [Candidatus Korarchaeota archaeon]
MKVLSLNAKEKELVIKIEKLEDLYWLTGIVERDDLVTAVTTRKIRVGGRESNKTERIPMKLTLRVEKITIDPYSYRTRISGIVLECPEKYSVKGRHHTINVKEGSIIRIVKSKWHPSFLALLDRAKEASLKATILLVAMDEEKAVVGSVDEYGLRELAEVKSEIPSKGAGDLDRSSYERTYFKKLTDIIQEYLDRFSANALIIAGPGFMKEKFMSYLTEKRPSIASIAKMGHASSATINGLEEILKRGEFKKLLQEISLTLHSKLVEELLFRVSKRRNLIAYGLDDVEMAVNAGAAEKVLILDKLLFSPENKARVLDILDMCEKTKAEFHILNSRSEPGRLLHNFGGIAALLRYPIA